MRRLPNRSVLTRISALLLAGALTLLVSSPTPSKTDAGWIDPEFATATVTTSTVPPVLGAKCVQKGDAAEIVWDPPAGGLPVGMRYKITLDDDPPQQLTQGTARTTGVTHRYSGSRRHPPNTPLIVRVYVSIPDPKDAGKDLWESIPSTLRMNYTTPKYSCVNN